MSVAGPRGLEIASLRSVLIYTAVERASQELNGRVMRPFDQRAAERRELVRVRLAEVHRTHAEDDDARRDADD